MILRRFRLLLPPAWALVGYVLVYLSANLPVMTMVAVNPRAPFPDRITMPRRAVLILGLIGYGMFRAMAFHPYFRSGYRSWLETTPWNWRLPLPVGPVHPVWEDAVILTIMAAPAWYWGDLPPLATMSLALGGYLAALCLSFGQTGAWGFQYVVSLVLALALRLHDQPAWGYTGVTLLGAVIAMVALGRALKRWPWRASMEFDTKRLESAFQKADGSASAPELGWPFDRLGPRLEVPPTRYDHLEGICRSLVVACWLYALLGLADHQAARGGVGFMALLYITLFTTIYRMTRYLRGYASPIGLTARLATFRPIVPSYDQVFLVPIAVVLATTALPYALLRLGLESDAAVAISLGLSLLCLWVGGPDRRRWHLTAKHRIVPAITAQERAREGYIQVG